MKDMKAVVKPGVAESILILAVIIGILFTLMVRVGTYPHIPLLIGVAVLVIYGLFKKVPFQTIQSGMTHGAASGLSAIFLFFFIGMLVSVLMLAGTIPTLMNAGLYMADWPFFFAAVFLVTALIGMSVGSSLTTTATIGIIFISMAQAIDVSLAITAGAVVSGAFFGDKMSPLSDTTNLASSVVGVDLFEHIRNMGWTTLPAFAISIVLFAFLSPGGDDRPANSIAEIQQTLESTGLVNWYSLIPILLLMILAIRRVPAMLSMGITIIVSIGLSYLHTVSSPGTLSAILFDGFKGETGMEAVDSLLTRGGIMGMMFTVSLVFIALAMGGLLFKLGIVSSILEAAEKGLRKGSSVLVSAAGTAFGINLFIGEQYLSILLTGETYRDSVEKAGLEKKNLSRVLEDAGTVINPLIPWGVSGAFITTALGVPTLEYLPFAFFCLLCPVLTVLFSLTGWTISKQS